MKITDLTGAYIKHILSSNNLPEYESSYPALFDHYFRYWGDRKKSFAKLTEGEINRRTRLINNQLKFIVNKFNALRLNTKDLNIVLFVGRGTSNGHAFRDGNRFVVWLPVETYDSPMLARVFVTHEIIHALHYTACPEFYFDSQQELRRVSRRLITEGIATYMAMRILEIDELTALWADYLPDDKADRWFNECRTSEKEIFANLLANFSTCNPDFGLFYASDPNDIFKFRAGYFAGLRLVEQLVEENNIELTELLAIQRDRFEKLLIERLRRIRFTG